MRGALASGRSALYSVTVRVAIVAVVVGVFCTWLAQGHVTLSGIEGPNNGWLCVLLAAPAFLWARSMERGSWVGVVGVLGCAFVIAWTATENWLDASRVLNAGVSHGLLLVLAACTVVAAVAVVHAVALVRDPAPHVRTGAAGGRARTAVAVTVLMLALLLVLVFRQVLGITQRPSWPPPANAVTAERAETATEAFAARDGTRPHDANLDFAWSTAATIEPWVEGKTFFPRIFADVEGARSSVHILMFGWREGQVGTEMADLLERKLAEGVEVRVIVDAFGSRPNGAAREMFTALADAGAQIVVQGDVAEGYFLICSGMVDVKIDNFPIRQMGPGRSFGEIALLRDIPRTATVTAVEPTEALVVSQDTFLEAVTGHPRSHRLATQTADDFMA